jgi:pyruvate,water dikinase
MKDVMEQTVWFEDLGRGDVARVGGKNAALGEMIRSLAAEGVSVPPGFATTAAAYRRFIEVNHLEQEIRDALGELRDGKASLAEAGARLRRAVVRGDWPAETAAAIREGYLQLSRRLGVEATDVAVRSSATAEDLPEASFAGQQESFLNIRGADALLEACRRCYASLFTDRAIAYRQAQGFDHLEVALSIGIQKMVRSDLAGAGVMFSIDTETGFDRIVLIDAAWGLGEIVVQGAVDPDEYQVFKPLLDEPGVTPIIEKKRGEKARKVIYATDGGAPTREVPTSLAERGALVLTDSEIVQLAHWARVIEAHYGMPMDMEWAKDGETGELFIVQARPETVQARRTSSWLKSYRIGDKGRVLAKGFSIGDAAVAGQVCLIENARDISRFVDGAVLVTGTTDPDWVPIMRRAAALVTDHGGRTSHAAIVSRELGLPAIVGAGNATHVLHDEQLVTVSCAEGDEGFVYEGRAKIETEEIDVAGIPATRTQVMLNLANPAAALRAGGVCPPTVSGSPAWSSSSIRTSRCTRWHWCVSRRSRTRRRSAPSRS